MKALIISDIHANIYALENIWKQEKDSDVIYCAGDLVDYGPFPKEVLQWIMEHKALCVKGNHDERVAALYRNKDQLWNVSLEERTWAHDNAQKLGEADIEFWKICLFHLRSLWILLDIPCSICTTITRRFPVSIIMIASGNSRPRNRLLAWNINE